MNTESLARALNSLPSENYEFPEVSFNENPDDTESLDSVGSCCNSPNQNSDGSMSPPPSREACDDAYFVFPDEDEGDREKNPDTKMKRKLECKVKRNERERRRVRRLADGFRKLREVVPGNYKKLSKLDTLRRALDYISSISELLETHDSGNFDNGFTGMNFIKQERNQVIIFFLLLTFLGAHFLILTLFLWVCFTWPICWYYFVKEPCSFTLS